MLKIPNINTKEDFEAHFQGNFWFHAAREICLRHQISYRELKRANGSEHIVFTIDDALVLKIYKPFRSCFEREIKALEFVGGKTDFKIPEIFQTGEFERFRYVLMTRLAGDAVTRNDWLQFNEKTQIEFITKLAAGLKQIHRLSADIRSDDWAEFVENRAATFIERQIAHGVSAKVTDALPKFIAENLTHVPTECKTVFMHADVHFGNLRVIKKHENLQIAGLFDFADSRRGFHEYEFLAVGVLMIQGQRTVQREFFRAYGYAEKELDEAMRRRLMMLTMLYETADLRRYALRLRPEAVDYALDKLEKEIWNFI